MLGVGIGVIVGAMISTALIVYVLPALFGGGIG